MWPELNLNCHSATKKAIVTSSRCESYSDLIHQQVTQKLVDQISPPESKKKKKNVALETFLE